MCTMLTFINKNANWPFQCNMSGDTMSVSSEFHLYNQKNEFTNHSMIQLKYDLLLEMSLVSFRRNRAEHCFLLFYFLSNVCFNISSLSLQFWTVVQSKIVLLMAAKSKGTEFHLLVSTLVAYRDIHKKMTSCTTTCFH